MGRHCSTCIHPEAETIDRELASSQRPLNLREAVEHFEREHIGMVLRMCRGNRERAAEELGISPATLYRRLQRLGLREADSELNS